MPVDSKINILVIDDDIHALKINRICLNYLGFNNVTEEPSSENALKRLVGGEKFDLIVCDWTMPVMSGLDLFKSLKDHPLLSSIPFIMVTSMAEKNRVIEALKAGIKHYIVKPLEREAMRAKIEACFSQQTSPSA